MKQKQTQQNATERIRSAQRAFIREQMIEEGFFNRPNQRAFKNKKAYTRNPKHRHDMDA